MRRVCSLSTAAFILPKYQIYSISPCYQPPLTSGILLYLPIPTLTPLLWMFSILWPYLSFLSLFQLSIVYKFPPFFKKHTLPLGERTDKSLIGYSLYAKYHLRYIFTFDSSLYSWRNQKFREIITLPKSWWESWSCSRICWSINPPLLALNTLT